jgi:hypothetical protein
MVVSIISPFFGTNYISLEFRLKKVPTKSTKASSIVIFIFMAIDACDDNRLRNKGIIKIRLNVRSPEGDVSTGPRLPIRHF